MNDTLNNDEINALLKDDEVNLQDLHDYDLTKNDSTAFNKLSSINVVNDSFIRSATTSLTEILNTPVELSVTDKVIERCNVYMAQLEYPTCINLAKINPHNQTALIVLNTDLVYTLVDKYFGGDDRLEFKKTKKEISTIEMRIVKLVLERLFLDIKEAWQRVIDIQFEYVESETNPQLMKCATKTDQLVISKFRIDIGKRGGELHICYPHTLIVQNRAILESGYRKEISDENWLKRIREELMNVELEANYVIAQRKISLKEVVNFKKDDVIAIEMPEEILIKINQIRLFKGSFGTYEGKYAAKITEKIQKDAKRS